MIKVTSGPLPSTKDKIGRRWTDLPTIRYWPGINNVDDLGKDGVDDILKDEDDTEGSVSDWTDNEGNSEYRVLDDIDDEGGCVYTVIDGTDDDVTNSG
jgi:hypothetical protein